MQSGSRRHLLALLAGLATGTAGCATTDDTTGTDTRTERPRLSNGVDSPSTRTLRNPAGTEAVRSSVVTPDSDAQGWSQSEWLLGSIQDREALTFADGVGETDAVDWFLDATDYEAATVLVVQRTVPECLTRQVESVRWDDTGVSVTWTTTERDVECDSDAPVDVQAIFVRIPGTVSELGYFASGRA